MQTQTRLRATAGADDRETKLPEAMVTARDLGESTIEEL
jgi:hypothetical protein